MGKHAFLITAYKNPDYLAKLVRDIDHERCYFFIHIDKKSKIEADPIVSDLKKKSNVTFLEQRLSINWGSYSHLEAIFSLLKRACSDQAFSHYHTLSGQCFAIKSIDEILNFFDDEPNKDYLSYHEMPAKVWSGNGGMDRLNYYHPHDWLNIKNRVSNKLAQYMVSVQKFLKINRKYSKELPKLYGGSTWWSISAKSAAFVIGFVERHPEFLARFKGTFCPEEFFFHTLIMNSPNQNNVVNDNLRYIDWERRNGNCPANLDESDLKKLLNGDKLFGRKIEPGISDGLITLLEKEKTIRS